MPKYQTIEQFLTANKLSPNKIDQLYVYDKDKNLTTASGNTEFSYVEMIYFNGGSQVDLKFYL